MTSFIKWKKRPSTDHIVVHCADTYARMDIGAFEIGQWHRQRSWLAIGYHFVIRRDGTVESGREEDVVGAHVAGHNYTSVGICLVGGKGDDNDPEDNFTDAQYRALEGLLAAELSLHPEAKIVGHNELNDGKACPSFDVQKWLADRPFPIDL